MGSDVASMLINVAEPRVQNRMGHVKAHRSTGIAAKGSGRAAQMQRFDSQTV